MRYHFGPELKLEPCSFGDHCPAKSHFDSKREATSTLEKAQRVSNQSFSSPVTGVSGEDLEFFLNAILESKSPSIWGPNPATRLEGKHSEEEIQRILQLLARDGVLNAVHRTDVQFVDGVEKVHTSGILWKVETTSWGGRKSVSLHSSLELTDLGDRIFDGLRDQAMEALGGEDLIAALEADGRSVEYFTEDLARLVDHRSELQKRAGSKLPGQIQELIDGTPGLDRLWTRSDIAEKFGCSISSATDIATKLTTWGILERTTQRNFYGPKLIAYRVALGPIAVLGGISALVQESEPELVAA